MEYGSDLYNVIKLGHILLFVYWLGGDIGVFYSAAVVSDPGLTPPQRATALKIMMWVDQIPRYCLVMMLPVGFTLAYGFGAVELALPGLILIPLWAIGVGWAGMLWWTHENPEGARKIDWARWDMYGRLGTIGLLLLIGLLGLGGVGMVTSATTAVKIIVYSGLIALGLGIRMLLKPFGPAFGQLMAEGSSEAVEKGIGGTIAKVRPLVVAIWIGLLFNAWMGIAKPL